jgi:hypothetical protein
MNNNTLFIFGVICAFGFAVALFIETSSWCVRSRSRIFDQGLFNSRANIYLYGSRAFLLTFVLSMSFLIDKKISGELVILVVATALTLALLLHLAFKYSLIFNKRVLEVILKYLALNGDGREKIVELDSRFGLMRNTAMATVILTFGVVSPFIIAQNYPDIRMTIGAFGQIINAFGTILLLLKVDPIMYRGMDDGTLFTLVDSYVDGRIVGLVASTIMAWCIFSVLKINSI